MNVNLFILALKPPEPPDDDFLILSSSKENMVLPYFELHENFPDIPIILEALLKKYIGYNNEVYNDFSILHASHNENVLSLYYYTFLNYNIELQDGIFQNIKRLSETEIYQKLFKRISLV